MKLHIITIGKPKLEYAKLGWNEYFGRLERLHTVHVTQLSDKFAYDSAKIREAQSSSYKVVLEIHGQQFTSEELAQQLDKLELMSKEISFLIGGPEGLPADIREAANLQWSLGKHTLPHDLAMVNLLEALYRASTIKAGIPYHK
jgi:23S rRNA (pseudouridine1915-N3)-methyltransferase